MRKIADKIAAHGLEAAKAGQILYEQKAATGMLVGNDNQLQELVAGRNFDGLTLDLPGLLTASPRFYELVVADNFRNAVVERPSKLKKPAGRRVRKLDDARSIRDDDPISDLIEDGGKPGSLRF